MNGHCPQWVKSGGQVSLGDSGAACGTSTVTVAAITTANYCPDTSIVANVLTCATSGTYTASNPGDVLEVSVANNTTGAVTLTVNTTLGPTAVTDTSGAALTSSNTLHAGGKYFCRYTSTGPAWQCTGPAGGNGSPGGAQYADQANNGSSGFQGIAVPADTDPQISVQVAGAYTTQILALLALVPADTVTFVPTPAEV